MINKILYKLACLALYILGWIFWLFPGFETINWIGLAFTIVGTILFIYD